VFCCPNPLTKTKKNGMFIMFKSRLGWQHPPLHRPGRFAPGVFFCNPLDKN
jgi:hypothetical protein